MSYWFHVSSFEEKEMNIFLWQTNLWLYFLSNL
jgi:hypothetical protein